MILYPTIELQGGRCVSLRKSDIADPILWHVDPVEKAREFAATGAEWMQVTDFDAITGEGDNVGLIEEIIRAAGIPVMVGGGVRTLDKAAQLIDLGAGRVVIGTAATRDPDMIHQGAKRWPDQIVLAVDIADNRVLADGWREKTAFEPASFVEAFAADPLAAILCTDVDADMSESPDQSLAVVSSLAEVAKVPVIASGLVRGVDDISRLQLLRNIGGAVVGRALFNRSVDLDEALAAAKPAEEPVAEFI